MKLLCRFFDPSQGRILWDGVDLRDVPMASLRRQITMLFQNPYYYPETAHNNIAVGDIGADLVREMSKRPLMLRLPTR